MTNSEFGNITLDILKPTQLLLVSHKSLTMTPPTVPSSPANDHFSCYKVRVSRNTPKFVPQPANTLIDQFGTADLIALKPTMLCAPADIDDQQPGAESHAGMLLCYKLKRPSTTPKFTPLSSVEVNNQWGLLSTDVKRPDQLCVLTQLVP
jgi:hypothetical protein